MKHRDKPLNYHFMHSLQKDRKTSIQIQLYECTAPDMGILHILRLKVKNIS